MAKQYLRHGEVGTRNINRALNEVAEDVTASPGEVSWDDVQGKPTSFPPSSHTHPIAQVDGLQDALDGKLEDVSWDDVQNKPASFPPSSHTHSIAQVDGLQAALDGKLGEVTQADIAPLVAGVSPIADPSEATAEDVAATLNALIAALGGG